MKNIIIYIIFGLIFFSSIGALYYNYIKYKNETIRLTNNQTTLMASLKTYKFRDSLNVVENGKLTLNINELEANREKDLALIKELKLKPAQVKTIIKTKIETRDSIVFQLKDSCLHYNTEWISVNGCIGDTLVVVSQDSIAQIAHKEYQHRFWFIKWGLKGFKVKTINFNPNSTVKSAEWIDLE